MMKSGQGDVLPEGYTRVEYVQGTGTKYLPLDITVAIGDTIVIDMQDDADTVNDNVIIFGHGTSGGCWVGSSPSRLYTLGGGANIQISTTQRVVGHIELTTSYYILTIGEHTTRRAINRSGSYALYGSLYRSKAKVYSLVIYRDGAAICKLVPCTNEDDEIGFYDTIRLTFFKY